MGNRLVKMKSGAPSQENQRAEHEGDSASRPAGETSPGKTQTTAQAHCADVNVGQITQEEKEAYIVVSSEEKEGERPQVLSQESSETPSIAMTAGFSEVASGILEKANLAPELVDSTVETTLRTDAQPIGLDTLGEACPLLLPEGSPKASPKTCQECSSAGLPSNSSAVSEEEVAVELASVVTLPVGMAESRKGTEGLHSPTDLSTGTEAPESDEKLLCEMYLELAVGNAWGAAKEQTTLQRELDETASAEAQQRMDGLCPNLILTLPCQMGLLELASENTEEAAEEPTSVQRQLEDEASLEKVVPVELHPHSVEVETSGGPLTVGTALGMKPLAEEQAMVPEVHTTTIQAQPLAEVTTAQSSPKAPLEAAETMKETEGACQDQPITEVTVAQSGNPEVQPPPETAPITGTTSLVVLGDKDAGFVAAAATCEVAEIRAGAGALEVQEKHDGKVADEQTEEDPVGSPKLITEKVEGDLVPRLL